MLTAGALALRTGAPEEEDTEVGPLIRPAEIERIDSWVQEAIDGGAAFGARTANETCPVMDFGKLVGDGLPGCTGRGVDGVVGANNHVVQGLDWQ